MNGSLLLSSSSSLLPFAIVMSPKESTDTGMDTREIAYTIQLAGLKITAYTMVANEIIKSIQLVVLSLFIYFHLKTVCLL